MGLKYGATFLMNNEDYTLKVIATAHAFRCGYEGQGNRLFAEILEGLISVTQSLDLTGANSVQALIPVMFDAQKRRDTIYLADLLEYELISRLSGNT